MKTKLFTLLLIPVITINLKAQTNSYINIDLGERISSRNIKVEDGSEFVIKILNLLPEASYEIEVALKRDTIPAIDLTEVLKNQSGSNEKCLEQLANILVEIDTLKNEIDLKRKIVALNKKIDDCGGKITDPILSAQIKELIYKTSKDYVLSSLTSLNRDYLLKGESIELTIKRSKNDALKIEEKTWTFVISPGLKRGSWKFSYGYSLDAGRLIYHDRYYLQPIMDSIYMLTPERKIFRLDSYPTVFLTYYSQKNELQSSFWGFTAGFGTNLQDVSIILAPSFVVQQNILISAGLSIRKIPGLKTNYDKNKPEIKSSTVLTFNDLHEDYIRPSFFFSASFRLQSNPFKKNDNE